MVSHSSRCSKPKIRVPACWVLMGAGLLTFCCILTGLKEPASSLASSTEAWTSPGPHLHELSASKYLTALGCFPWISEPYLHLWRRPNPALGPAVLCSLRERAGAPPCVPWGSSEAASMISSNHSALQDRGWHPASGAIPLTVFLG